MPDGLLGKLLVLVLASTLACKSKSPDPEPTNSEQSAVAAEPEPPSDAAMQRARAMTKAFASELQSTLLAAIESGGPAHAISVCKHDAPRIAAEQASEGWTLRRTALRVRNPDNSPSAWQQTVLERWQSQLEAGEVSDPAALEWAELVDGSDGAELRYMRAIPLGGVCMACHGPADQLLPEVAAAIAEHYPEDQATGFRVGELRGAFVVTGPV